MFRCGRAGPGRASGMAFGFVPRLFSLEECKTMETKAIATAAPDPDKNPVEFLRHHGWTPTGDVRVASVRWRHRDDPTTERIRQVPGLRRPRPDGTEEVIYQTECT